MKQVNKIFTQNDIRLALGNALMDINKTVINEVPKHQKIFLNKLLLRMIAVVLANLGIDKEM
jgi:hypothetical protein